jgi:hypothetical protein
MFKRLHSRFWQFAIVIGIMLSLFLASCAQTLVDPIQLSTTNQTLSLTNPNAHETKIQLLNPTKEEYFRYE